MKKIFAYLALAATVTFATSCNWEAASPDFFGEDSIALSLAFEAPATRAEGVGLENEVTSVEYFFYSDVTGVPVYRKYVANPTLTDNAYKVSLVVGEGELADKSLNDFFPNGAGCEFFAVFNYPEEIGDLALAEVKNKAVVNTFAHNADGWKVTEDGEAALYPKYFVMTGQATLTADPKGITGTIDMKRIAAKISFVVNVTAPAPTTVDGVTETWKPMLNDNNPRIYLTNTVGNALVGGADAVDAEAGTGPVYPETLGQFDYSPIILDFGDGTTATSPAFYTFPLAWESGADTEINCKLIIPWMMERTQDGIVTYSTQRELYYKINFPEQIIESNNWYVFTVNATFLGHEGEEPTIDIVTDKAQVLPWTATTAVNPVISAAKYLSVEKGARDNDGQHPVTIYTSGITISYAASDVVTLVVKNIYQPNLSTGSDEYLIQDGAAVTANISARQNKINTDSEAQWSEEIVRGWITHDTDGNLFELSHLLNSDLISNNMDATPYHYEIELHLGAEGSATYNDAKYIKTVDIIQYPQVYVLEDPNTNASNNSGGVFINGSQEATTRWQRTAGGWGTQATYWNLGGVHGLTGQNQNPNMYVLTISVSNDYNIGDPRGAVSVPAFTYNNTNHYAQASWTGGTQTNHRLTNYHPAASSGVDNIIAPKIRIASSYGVCTTGRNEDEGILRCATYQEDGIPAGRWRLPTLAEVKYIATLSANKRIPYLFGSEPSTGPGADNDSYYYIAGGLIHVNNSSKVAEKYTGNQSGENLGAVARCVYDEWFWGDSTTSTRPVAKNEFTWGDNAY